MNAGIQTELNYKIQVEPVIHTILNQVASDCEGFGLSSDDIIRAVWVWADNFVNESPPQWLWTELARRQQASEADNTIEGEAGP